MLHDTAVDNEETEKPQSPRLRAEAFRRAGRSSWRESVAAVREGFRGRKPLLQNQMPQNPAVSFVPAGAASGRDPEAGA